MRRFTRRPAGSCRLAGGFELDLAIPDEDPTTYGLWVVSGRNERFS
jgi:hypothetical protein